MRRVWAWLKAGLREAFYGRRPRRARCACGHRWFEHSSRGCGPGAGAACPCNLNRHGKTGRHLERLMNAALREAKQKESA